jgi:superfamily II DNA or RNA helicase
MGLVITGAKRIPLTHPKVSEITQDLTFTNPFEPDKDFKAYFTSSTEIIIPRAYPLDGDYVVDVVDSQCTFKLASGYTLRDYQEKAVGEIIDYFNSSSLHGELLLSANTGSGKTFAMAGLLSKLMGRTIILSHLSMLSTQMFKEMSKNLKGANIKILDSNDTDKELPDIAICSFQLLDSNRELLLKLKDYYSIVIVDEAENCFTRSRLKTLFTLKPKFQIYLTATPTRELMRQTQGLNYLFGNKVIEMSAPEEHKIHSKHLFIDYRPMQWNSPQNSNLYKTSLGKFLLRSVILKDIAKACKELKDIGVNGTFWIVADLNVVQDKLYELIEAQGLTVRVIRGTTSSKKRDVILQEIHDKIVDVIIGSAPLSAGLSIPELSIGFRLLPNSSSDELLEQQKGRLNRHIHWKDQQHPLWVDFLISGNLEYGAKKRWGLYQQTTHGVSMCKPLDIVKEIHAKIRRF